MKRPILVILLPLAVLILLIVSQMFFYTLQETEQAVITQFGKPVGEPVTEAGLHMKLPLVQDVNRLKKQVMEWESSPEQVPTADKLFIIVDTYARWRIGNPLLYFQSLREEILAQSRLDDILDGETRNAIAKHQLIELVRTDKMRRPQIDPTMTSTTIPSVLNWKPISLGRDDIAHEIYTIAKEKLAGMGIDLIDIRFKRIKYNDQVQAKIFERMISERQQIAEKFRSEGQGQAAQILGEKARELNRIESEAYRKQMELRGKADADATDIYAKAYNQSPEAVQFYQFMKSMETLATTLDKNATLIMSTQGDLFKFLKSGEPGATPAAGTGPVAGAKTPATAAPTTTSTATRR